jgi:hypothetical protein
MTIMETVARSRLSTTPPAVLAGAASPCSLAAEDRAGVDIDAE